MTIYNQNNYPTYLAGFNTSLSVGSIALVGCLIVSFSNMFQYVGINLNPLKMNEKLKESGCFTHSGAFYIRDSISKAFPEISEQNFWGYPQKEVAEALANPNKVVILGVDFNPIVDGYQSHYVGLYNTNSMIDPNGGVTRSINHYGAIVQTLIFTKTIKQPEIIMQQIDTYQIAIQKLKQNEVWNKLDSGSKYALEYNSDIAYPISNSLMEIERQKNIIEDLKVELQRLNQAEKSKNILESTYSVDNVDQVDNSKKEDFSFQKFFVGASKNGMLYAYLSGALSFLVQSIKVAYPEYSQALDILTGLIALGGGSATISNGTQNIIKK